MPISEDILKKYMNYYFAETGSAGGVTISKALSAGFKEIFSVDLKRKRYKRCRKKFSKNTNVNLHCGKSSHFIREIIKSINAPITFWLDAHGNDVNEHNPLLEELIEISKHHIKTHTILIDDMRLMGQGVYPSQETIIQHLKNINSDYVISYENNYDSKHDIHRKNEIMVARLV